MDNYTLKPLSISSENLSKEAGYSVVEKETIALFSIAPFQGQQEKTNDVLKEAFGLELPDIGKTASDKGNQLYDIARNQWMLESDRSEQEISALLNEKLGNHAAITDQTDSWCCFELSGERVIDKLERICPINLLDSAFPVGAVVRTSMEHIGVIIRRDADQNDSRCYRILGATSYRNSLLHALVG